MQTAPQLLSVACNHCGAPLSVPPAARFVTCTYCGSPLAVHHSGGAAYTEVLQDIHAHTTRIVDNTETIKLQNQLEQLDREWMIERERYMIRDKDGSRLPTEGGRVTLILGAVLTIVFGILWIVMAGQIDRGLGAVGGVIILAGVVNILMTGRKASAYRAAEKRYQSRRASLLRALADRGQSS